MSTFDKEPRVNISNYNSKYFNIIKFSGYKTYNVNRKALWRCKCKACGNIKDILQESIINNKLKSCGCARKKSGRLSHGWKGFGDISGVQYSGFVSNAKARNKKFNVSIQYLWNIFLKQNRKCALTGYNLFFHKNEYDRGNASIDRINPSKGYIKGNIRWVHKDINYMRHTMTDKKLIFWCKKIIKFNK